MELLVFLAVVVVFAAGTAAALYADGLPKRVRRRDGRDRQRARRPPAAPPRDPGDGDGDGKGPGPGR